MEFGNERKSSSSKDGMRVEIDEESEEARQSKGLPCGIKPSQKMIDDHERTHLPFRSWCKHCVMGRAQEHPHRKIEKEDRRKSERGKERAKRKSRKREKK